MLAVHLTNCLLGDHMTRLLYPNQAPPTTDELRQRAAEGLDLFLRSVLR